VTRISGHLNIYSNDLLLSLSGLDSLTELEGIALYNNPVIEGTGAGTISGTMYDIYVYDNPLLTELNILHGVTDVGNWVKIHYSHAIDTPILPNLRTVEGDIEITHNESTSLSGLASLEYVGKNLDIEWSSYISIPAFPSLTYIGGTMSIKENTVLNSITGFNALETVEHFYLYGNGSLSDIDSAYSSLTLIDGNFRMTHNPSLPDSQRDALIDRVTISGSIETD
jgi:hypothetical protein